MRSGTSSMSANPQTSFCQATQERISSSPWHFRTRIEPAFIGRSIPAVFLVAIRIPVPAWEPAAEGVRRAAVDLPSIEIAAGTYGLFFAGPIPNPPKDSARYSPARTKDVQPRLPDAGGDPRKS